MNLRFIIVFALLAAGTVQAQLKLPAEPKGAPGSPNTPASPTAPMPPATDPVAEAKQEAAARVATEWLKLIDNAEYGKAWDECSALFREKVTRQQWVDGIPKNRADYGKFKARKLDGTAYRKELPGAPDGDYVTVHFISDYEKNPVADELVTLVYQNGAWRPIGYLLK
jgi:Protein of unknown function (DUF4019)